MSDTARRPVVPIVPGRHARMPGLAGLHRVCLATLIALVVQFSLGMILNLYVSVPASDAHAGYLQEIRTAPFALTVHVLLGLGLIGAAGLLLVRAIGLRDQAMIALAAAGLGGILGAFVAGEIFVKDGENSTSLAMTIMTGVALVCYVAALGRTSTVHLQGHRPVIGHRPAVGHRPAMGPPPYPAGMPHPARMPRPAGVPQPRFAFPPGGPRPGPDMTGPLPRRPYPPTGPQPRAPFQTGPLPRISYQTGPQPQAPFHTGPQPQAPFHTGPQPQAPFHTGPQPRAGYPPPPSWPPPEHPSA